MLEQLGFLIYPAISRPNFGNKIRLSNSFGSLKIAPNLYGFQIWIISGETLKRGFQGKREPTPLWKK